MFPSAAQHDATAEPSSAAYPRSNSSILRLGDEAIMQFVDLCRREECLWNSDIPEYRSKERRQRAIVDIARELDIDYFESQHVWLKFRNLRNTYCQELKKIAASGGSYTPKVIWFSKIDSFLRPYIQGPCALPHTTAVKQEEEEIEEDSDDIPLALAASLKTESTSEDEAPAWWTRIQTTCSEHQPLGNEGRDDTRSLDQTTTHKRHSDDSGTTPAKHQKLSEGCTEQTGNDLNYSSEQVQQSPQDLFDYFGRYVASLLRSLPRKKGMLLQPQIVNLITVSAARNLPDRPLP